MSFLLEALALVAHLILAGTTFGVFFMSLTLSSQTWIFLYHNLACDVSFYLQLEAHKFDTVQGSYEVFTLGCRSHRWMASRCNRFRVFFISLALSSQNDIILYQHVVCDVSFDWQLEAHKSDTVRGSYDLFTAGCRFRRWMASCCNHFGVFFISRKEGSKTEEQRPRVKTS
jgi:hypothetical protein